MATTHLVYRIRDRSSFHNLVCAAEPIPSVGDHEVLVRVRGVTLNYRDLIVCNGQYPFPVKDDVVPCADSAGDVVAVGSAVTDVRVGDRVITSFNLTHVAGPLTDMSHALGGSVDGVLREYMAVPAQSVSRVPSDCTLSYVQLASLVASGVTSWNALFGGTPLRPGQIVLLQGTGGVAIAGLQYAKAAGAVTIVTSSSDDKLAFVKDRFGADFGVNYRSTPDWAAEVKRLTGGRGVDHVLESGGSGTIRQSIEACAPGGVVSVIGFLSPAAQQDMPDVAGLVLAHEATVRGVQLGGKLLQDELVRFVAAKRIEPHVHETFGFSPAQVAAAFEALQASKHIGKIGIDVDAK